MVIPRQWRAARKAPRILTLTATPISTTQINLSWTVDPGNVGLAGFKIYVNGALFQALPQNPNMLGFPVTGLSPSTSYAFAVAPYDTLGVEYAAAPIVQQSTGVPATGAIGTATAVPASGLAGGDGAASGAGVALASSMPTGFATGGSGGSGLAITTASLPNASQGLAYSQQLAASGGTAPYKWSLLSGALNPLGVTAFGPTPGPGLSLKYDGTLQGLPPFAEVDTITVLVTDAVGATAKATLPLTTVATALAFSATNPSGNPFQTNTDPVNPAHYTNLGAWNGASGQILVGRSSRSFTATVPNAYAPANINGYPYVGRGWYPFLANPCAPANGGSSAAPGVSACIQISALTKARMRWVMQLPIDRLVAQYNTLGDMYCYDTAVPPGGVTGQFDETTTRFSLSVFPNFLDTAQYWSKFLGTAAPGNATLTASNYNAGPSGTGFGNVAGRIELDGRMWFYTLGNENWAITPPAGKYNCGRFFPSPWNDIHQVGSMYLDVDMAQFIKDLLASPIAGNLPITSASYFSGPFGGWETDGLSTRHNLAAITKSVNMVFTVNTVVATNPFAVGDRFGIVGAGGMTQATTDVGTVLAVGGASGAWTVTTDRNSTAFTTYTSGGYAHKSVCDSLDFQTALQNEADPIRYTVPELSHRVSLYLPIDASADDGTRLKAYGRGADPNKIYGSSGSPSAGSPIHYAFNVNSLTTTQRQHMMLTWNAYELAQDGNTGFFFKPGDASFWMPGAYSIQANPSTSATYPTTGWVTIGPAITGNTRRERTHYLGDLSAHGWVQIAFTGMAPTDVFNTLRFNVSLHDAPNVTGRPDGWDFLGDSHFQKSMLWGDSEEGGASDSFSNMMFNMTGHNPVGICMGNSAWALCVNGSGYGPSMSYIDGTLGTWLDDSPVRYTWYGLGYNDPAASVTPTTYLTTLARFLNLNIAMGREVVVAGIMFTFGDNGAQSDQWTVYNYSLVNLALTGITRATSPVLTMNLGSTINPLAVGQAVQFVGVGGMTQINGLRGVVTAIGGSTGAWTATLSGIDSSGFSAFTSGGSITRPQIKKGPDFSSIFRTIKAIAFNPHDTIHLAPYGQVIYRGMITDYIGRVIYLGLDPAAWKVPFKIGSGSFGLGGIAGTG